MVDFKDHPSQLPEQDKINPETVKVLFMASPKNKFLEAIDELLEVTPKEPDKLDAKSFAANTLPFTNPLDKAVYYARFGTHQNPDYDNTQIIEGEFDPPHISRATLEGIAQIVKQFPKGQHVTLVASPDGDLTPVPINLGDLEGSIALPLDKKRIN